MHWLAARGPCAVPRIIWILILGNVALGIAFLALDLLSIDWWELRYVFNLGEEQNLPTWWSTVQLFAAAVVMAAVADKRATRGDARSWTLWLLPMVLVAMSVDETARIHELVGMASDIVLPDGTREGTAVAQTGIWFVALGVPAAILIGALVLGARPVLREPPGAFAKMTLGFAMILLGGVLLEALSNVLDPDSLVGFLEVGLEEMLEMFGTTLILWAGLECLPTWRQTDRPGSGA